MKRRSIQWKLTPESDEQPESEEIKIKRAKFKKLRQSYLERLPSGELSEVSTIDPAPNADTVDVDTNKEEAVGAIQNVNDLSELPKELPEAD